MFTQKNFKILYFIIVQFLYVECSYDIGSALKYVANSGSKDNKTFPDEKNFLSKYDFIIVGAGSAGCVLANRLSENPKWKIILIEAGGDEDFLMDIPMVVHYLQILGLNWHYKTEPSNNYCLAMENNQCNFPRGKVMGGSSTVNFMIYTRGNKKDYDRWEELGNEGWNYRNVSHYFRKLEKNIAKNITPNYHGKRGPLTISSIDFQTEGSHAFVKAGIEKGFKFNDPNGPNQMGFSYTQATIANGTRQSANVAYLYPISSYRKNLHVKKYSLVTKILIDENKKAFGVEFKLNGKIYTVKATKEVILSAGAINTPQLLMLSGIGPKKHLNRLKIKTVANLAVGYNLMDHVSTGLLSFKVNSTSLRFLDYFRPNNVNSFVGMQSGRATSAGGVEALAFIDTENSNSSYPNIEFLSVGAAINADIIFKINMGIRRKVFNDILSVAGFNANTLMIMPMLLHPKSRGRILLRSSDPHDKPLIYANYFSDVNKHDVRTLIKSIRFIKELESTKSFKNINAKFLKFPLEKCDKFEYDSDDYWECFIRHFSITIYHQCGTAKMGPASDRNAVVDSTLKVYGVKRLRVVDASIMPEIISGHTNGPTIMIAEKAADMIKNEWRK